MQTGNEGVGALYSTSCIVLRPSAPGVAPVFFCIPVSHPCAPEGFKIVNISGTQVTVHVCGNCLTSSSRMPYKATRYSAPCVPLQDPSECE